MEDCAAHSTAAMLHRAQRIKLILVAAFNISHDVYGVHLGAFATCELGFLQKLQPRTPTNSAVNPIFKQ
jgi:hypothetical protein